MKRLEGKFTVYNDGVLFVCKPGSSESSFSAVLNTTEKKAVKKILQLDYVELSKREQDVEFAESQGHTLSMKVKTRLHKSVTNYHRILIGEMLYSIIKLDKNTRKEEMYIYLEEERKLS